MTISDFDKMPLPELKAHLLKCCGSTAWVEKMIAILPVDDMVDLLECADEKWDECSENDWKEAFAQHPEIGDTKSIKPGESAEAWAKNEQSKVSEATDDVKQQIAEGNRLYKEKFGYIFIINATGKTAREILASLQVRLQNNPETEIEIAMGEQIAITKIRLEKLLKDE